MFIPCEFSLTDGSLFIGLRAGQPDTPTVATDLLAASCRCQLGPSICGTFLRLRSLVPQLLLLTCWQLAVADSWDTLLVGYS
jgi:hypothetical protein